MSVRDDPFRPVARIRTTLEGVGYLKPPEGRRVKCGRTRRKDNRDDVGTGVLGLIGNIIWFIFAGIWLAIGHVLAAIACFVTIIGIPFGVQHLKLAGIALAPIGKTIVTKEVAAAARRQAGEATVANLRDGR